jgi:protoheme IX farnesyltransferase
VSLGLVGFAVLAIFVNVLSAVLAAAAMAFYVFVYTVWLKRRSVQNIVIGGAAGAVPVLVGWAAVTGKVTAAPFVLFAIVFLWTPPHFWSLAIVYERDYATARLPMMPVVKGRSATAAAILRYTIAVGLVSIVLAPIAGLGAFYLISALALGGWFLDGALRLRSSPSPPVARALFRRSIAYLALLFGAIAIDPLLHIAWM